MIVWLVLHLSGAWSLLWSIMRWKVLHRSTFKAQSPGVAIYELEDVKARLRDKSFTKRKRILRAEVVLWSSEGWRKTFGGFSRQLKQYSDALKVGSGEILF